MCHRLVRLCVINPARFFCTNQWALLWFNECESSSPMFSLAIVVGDIGLAHRRKEGKMAKAMTLIGVWGWRTLRICAATVVPSILMDDKRVVGRSTKHDRPHTCCLVLAFLGQINSGFSSDDLSGSTEWFRRKLRADVASWEYHG